jgi:predicted flap endonuclease-1-like 5' DNA nuclease
MASYWWLILGILIGWMLQWLLEIICWRSRRQGTFETRVEELEGSLDECHRGVAHLRGEIEQRDLRIAELEQSYADALETRQMAPEAPSVEVPGEVEVPEPSAGVPDLAVEVADMKTAAQDLALEAPEAESAAPPAVVRVDDLTLVRGIGPKTAATLAEAGITSFAQLAEMDEAQLSGIVQAPDWQRVDYADWIQQASTLRDTPPAEPVRGDELTFIEGIGPKYAELLRDAGITTFGEVAASGEGRLRAIINAPAWRRVDYPMWIEQARLIVAGEDEALAELQDRLHRREGDNLALIAGVGDKAKAALIGAGIASFADLATTDEERLAGIIEGAGLRPGDYTSWREEAALRAAGRRVARLT